MKKEINYKIKLTNIQINNIYMITDNKEKQGKIMSILAYLMKYTDAETMKLVKSLNRLYNMYLRYHNYIARSYFYRIAKLILDNNYFLYKPENKKMYSLVDKINSAQTTETTSLDDDFKKPNNIITNHNINTYTLNTTSVVNAVDLVEYVFKDLKVKSKVIKAMVIGKIKNITLDAAGAVNYIVKVITEKTMQYRKMRENYAKKVYETKKKENFCKKNNNNSFINFKGRDHADSYYKDLEDKLVFNK